MRQIRVDDRNLLRRFLGSSHAAVSSGALSGRRVTALLAEHIPRRDRVALPPRRRRNLVAAHHQRRRADGGARAQPCRGQRHAMRAQRRTLLEDNGVHPHHAVVEQVRLHDASAVDGGALLQRDQVRLGQPVGLAPHASTDLRAERPQPQVHHRRAGRGAGEPRRRDRLDEGVRHLVAPDERRPQRVLDRPGYGPPQPISQSPRWRPQRLPRPAARHRCRAPPTASRTRRPGPAVRTARRHRSRTSRSSAPAGTSPRSRA